MSEHEDGLWHLCPRGPSFMTSCSATRARHRRVSCRSVGAPALEWIRLRIQAAVLQRDTHVPKSHHTLQSSSVKTTEFMGKLGLGAQHSKPLSMAHEKEHDKNSTGFAHGKRWRNMYTLQYTYPEKTWCWQPVNSAGCSVLCSPVVTHRQNHNISKW